MNEAIGALGSGSRVSAQDTVPYCLWCAAHHLQDYVQALWTTVSGMGDRDTTCAIVGGIVAISIPPDHLNEAIGALGSGSRVSAQDTVPYCLWCAAHHLRDYAQALWTTVSGMGDRDTTCAIVGGIVVLSAGQVPEDWRQRREPLPEGF
ncbi:MAG: ADP-ribosylglycohydrolase family protein [Anaerolineales bacterium]